MQLRGNPDHPYSKGELCPKVNRFLDRVYSPDRILHPLRRVGPKGSGQFEQISWDDALAEIAIRSHDSSTPTVPRRSCRTATPGTRACSRHGPQRPVLESLRCDPLVRAICGPTVGAGVKMTNGTDQRLDPLEIRHAKLIILWGTNTKLTNRHLWPTIEAARADGAKVVVIDPIRTTTAEAATGSCNHAPAPTSR